MKYTLEIKDFEMTAHDFAVILYDLLFAGENNFYVECPKEFEHLLVGECYEDQLANVLWNGGYLNVHDALQFAETIDEVVSNSEVLSVSHYYYDEDWNEYCPVYKLTRERVEEAIKQIICKSSPKSAEVYKSLMEILDDEEGNPDFFDYWNVFQYIMLGEVVYG